MTRLVIALVATAAVAALELWGGWRSHSLALTSDAVHVCMDTFALALAIAAAYGARRPANARKTFGYGRLEVLGALANSALLFAATIAIVYAAVRRFAVPALPESTLMVGIAAIGLIANACVGLLLRREGAKNINVRAALFHVAGDALGALAVIVGGVIIAFTHVAFVDPLLSLFVSGIIVFGVARVLRDAADVLLEGAPRGLDVGEVARRLGGLPGVIAVHDLHVWTIGPSESALAAHLALDDCPISQTDALRAEIDRLMRDAFSITHTTLQFECRSCVPAGDEVCTQVPADLGTSRARQ